MTQLDERTLSRFTAGLPVPPLNKLQDRLAVEIVRLAALADEPATRAAEAGGDVWDACKSLAEAMGAAGVERNADGEPVPPYDYDDREAANAYDAARAPWNAAETWILRTGSGTGSARALAVCYLGRLLGLAMDWRDVYSPVLDESRAPLATDMLTAPRPARLPQAFWRIFIVYRDATVREWERQGSRLAPVSTKTEAGGSGGIPSPF